MIDTITVEFNMLVPEDLLRTWDHDCSSKANGKGYNRYLLTVKLENGASIKLIYYPRDYRGNHLLLVEVSLPHVVFGNNCTMLYDFRKGATMVNEALAKFPEVPELDLMHGVISRLDICYNHQVGNSVPYLIKALQQLEFSHRKTVSYGSEGVQYKSIQTTTKFYNKEKESKNPAAFGILRQETTLRKKAVQKLVGKARPTLQDIQIELLGSALEEELEHLHLLNISIANRDEALKIYCEKCEEIGGIFYFGLHVGMITEPSKEAFERVTGSHPRTLERRLKKLYETVGPLTLTDHLKPLPALSINYRDALGELEKNAPRQEAPGLHVPVLDAPERLLVSQSTK